MISRREFGRLIAGGAAVASLGAQDLEGAHRATAPAAVVVVGPRHEWLQSVERSAEQVASRTGLRLSVRYVDEPVLAPDDAVGADLLLLNAGGEADRALAVGQVVDIAPVVRSGRLDLSARTDFELALATAGTGALAGVPFVSDSAVLYHRLDLPTALGGRNPESFDDLVAAAYQLTDETSGVGGIAILDDLGTIAPVLYSFGGFVADGGAIGLTSVENAQAYGVLRQLTLDCSGGLGPARGLKEAVDRFVSGRARLLLAGGGLLPLLDARVPGEEIRCIPLPAGPVGNVELALPTWVVAMSATTTSQERAVKVLQALVDVSVDADAVPDGALPVGSLDMGNPGTDPEPGFTQEATRVDAMPEALTATVLSTEGRHAVVAPMLSEDVSAAQIAAEDLLVRATS